MKFTTENMRCHNFTAKLCLVAILAFTSYGSITANAASSTNNTAIYEQIFKAIAEVASGTRAMPKSKREIEYDRDSKDFSTAVYASMRAGLTKITVKMDGYDVTDWGPNAVIWTRAVRTSGGQVYQCPFDKKQGFAAIIIPILIPELIKLGKELIEDAIAENRVKEYAGKYYMVINMAKKDPKVDDRAVDSIVFVKKRRTEPFQPKPQGCREAQFTTPRVGS